ncbi:hypothetical protein FNV43_RR24476 [Rhamnella rubrinervis]|uniref:Uncharacterized protein n=1 Tax=Rhamnella rubrinervis TaxID=2594499 RepID=A0A8K0GP52_9ROSA|nr:hypothetical protein FNV43_RR24476 [Rhamnella rubrinervis]
MEIKNGLANHKPNLLMAKVEENNLVDKLLFEMEDVKFDMANTVDKIIEIDSDEMDIDYVGGSYYEVDFDGVDNNLMNEKESENAMKEVES